MFDTPSFTPAGATILAAFLASLVEFVEALTIVLAAGVTRGWRSSLMGTAAAAILLAVLTAALGPAIERIPLERFQLFIGVLLLLFGMRWARKAILRSAGVLKLHDEAEAFVKKEAELRKLSRTSRTIDWAGFGTAFQGVFIEGVEVVFIVIAVGGGSHNLMAASAGAGAAAVLVIALGLVIHRPLTRAPENTLKYLVAVMLSSFGTFWVGEGLQVEWPGGDWALLLLIAAYLAVFAVSVQWARRRAALPVAQLAQ